MVGVFSLFALASGILRLSAAGAGSPMLKAVVDGAVDGLLVTDADGRVIYANAAYLDLIDASDAERRAAGRARVHRRSGRVGGDLSAAQGGARGPRAAGGGARRRPRAAGRRAGCGCACARSASGRREARLTVWSVADVTRDRERQENVFQELQHAIDYLDHAPAGFFSVDAKGDIVYLNATLANWLDHDLAQVGSGGLKLADIVWRRWRGAADDAAGAPGEVKTEVLDLDCAPAAAARCRCGSFTRSRSAPTARRAPRARWCSTAPATTAPIRSAPPKSASCASSTTRRWRSPPSTSRAASSAPMRCSRGCSTACSERRGRGPLDPRRRRRARPAGARSRDPCRGGQGKADIAPVDAALAGRRASASAASTSRRSRRRSATRKRPSSTRSRPPSSASWRTRSPRRRRWSSSASSPAASRTTSTTCCPPS